MADKAVYLHSSLQLDGSSTFVNNSALYLYAKLLAWFRSVGKKQCVFVCDLIVPWLNLSPSESLTTKQPSW